MGEEVAGGVVDQPPRRSERRARLRNPGVHALGVAHVDLRGQCRDAVRAAELRRLLDRLRRRPQTAIGAPRCGQRERERASHAGAAAR